MINRLNLFFEVLPERLHPWRWWVILLYVVLISFLAAGIPRFAFTWANDDMFGKEDPVQISLDRIKELYGGTVSLLMVYRPVDGDIFSNKSLQALRNVHDFFDEESARSEDDPENPLGLITEVESLLNASYIDVEEDSIHFRDFIDEELPLKSGQNRLLLEQGLQEPEYPRVIFSDNTEYGIVMFRTNLDAVPIEHGEQNLLKDGFEEDETKGQSIEKLQFVEHGLNDYAGFERAVWKILQKERFRKDLEFQHPHWGAFYNTDVWNSELQIALIISLFFSLGLTCLLLGSLRSVIWPTLIILSSMIGVLGLAGWTGWPIDISLYITFGLVGVATVADVVHVLSGYLYFHQQGQTHHQAMHSVFSKTAMACLLTSITTSIGVFSLYFIQLSVIQTMGLLAGIGVLFAFILTIILLPVLMNWFPPRPALKENHITEIKILKITQRIIHIFEKLSVDYPKRVIVLFAIASMILILGMFRIEINTVFSEFYPPDSPVRKTSQLLDNQFFGTGNMEILIEGETEGIFRDPQVLQALELLDQTIKKLYPDLVKHSWTMNNQLKQTHRKLMDNSAEAYSVPDEPSMVAQLLVLIEGGNNEDLERLVSLDYAKARMSVSTKTLGSKEAVEILLTLQPKIDQIFEPLKKLYPGLKATLTGGVGTWARVFDAISWSQIRSFGLAFLIISMILIGIFGSLKMGLIAIIPNTFPMLTVFGLMGWADLKLNTTTLFTAPIIIGIAVDDTIHFLTHYRLSLIKGQSIGESINSTLREVGQAIFFTTLILISLFLCFIPVNHVGVSHFAILAVVAVIAALIADLLLLPALCRVFDLQV